MKTTKKQKSSGGSRRKKTQTWLPARWAAPPWARPRPPPRVTSHLYFAYGSNLRVAQMRARCGPGVEVVGSAVLPGWRLAFAGHSARWGGMVATIAHAPGGEVHGALYRITGDALAALDRHEGHPHAYRRIDVHVRDATTGLRRRAVTYVLRTPARLVGGRRRRDAGGPTTQYLDAIVLGYMEHHLDTRVLVAALEREWLL